MSGPKPVKVTGARVAANTASNAAAFAAWMSGTSTPVLTSTTPTFNQESDQNVPGTVPYPGTQTPNTAALHGPSVFENTKENLKQYLDVCPKEYRKDLLEYYRYSESVYKYSMTNTSGRIRANIAGYPPITPAYGNKDQAPEHLNLSELGVSVAAYQKWESAQGCDVKHDKTPGIYTRPAVENIVVTIQNTPKLQPLPVELCAQAFRDNISQLVPHSDKFFQVLAENSCYIAGGAVTASIYGSKIKDIDIFHASNNAYKNQTEKGIDIIQAFANITEFITKHCKKWIIYKTKNTISLLTERVRFEMILLAHHSVHKILRRFDLAPSMYLWSNDGQILTNALGAEAYLKGWINMDVTQMTATIYARIHKYMTRGFALRYDESAANMLLSPKFRINSLCFGGIVERNNCGNTLTLTHRYVTHVIPSLIEGVSFANADIHRCRGQIMAMDKQTLSDYVAEYAAVPVMESLPFLVASMNAGNILSQSAYGAYLGSLSHSAANYNTLLFRGDAEYMDAPTSNTVAINPVTNTQSTQSDKKQKSKVTDTRDIAAKILGNRCPDGDNQTAGQYQSSDDNQDSDSDSLDSDSDSLDSDSDSQDSDSEQPQNPGGANYAHTQLHNVSACDILRNNKILESSGGVYFRELNTTTIVHATALILDKQSRDAHQADNARTAPTATKYNKRGPTKRPNKVWRVKAKQTGAANAATNEHAIPVSVTLNFPGNKQQTYYI